MFKPNENTRAKLPLSDLYPDHCGNGLCQIKATKEDQSPACLMSSRLKPTECIKAAPALLRECRPTLEEFSLALNNKPMRKANRMEYDMFTTAPFLSTTNKFPFAVVNGKSFKY